jgi:phosphoenolpyruvate carboxylase
MSDQSASTLTTSRPQANNLLRRDVRFLGNILGEVLVHQGGRELLDIVEGIREQSKALRAEFVPELFDQFKETIAALNPEIRHQVIRAFAIYFQLVNIAEQNHRIRRKRDYEVSAGESVQRGSIESAVQELKERGIGVDDVQDILSGISLELVMTAHPTEATRRAVLDIHKRIAIDVMELDNPTLTYREREKLREKLMNEVLIPTNCATASQPLLTRCVTDCTILTKRCLKCCLAYTRSLSAALASTTRMRNGMCPTICVSAPGSAATATAIRPLPHG